METSTLPVEPREIPGAGYGLVAVRRIPPATPIFIVPASALLNCNTLQPHYPPKPVLSGTQLVSLHLLLYRPLDHLPSTDPLFGPYISVLPSSFHAHPLTWLWKERVERNENSVESHLLALLPPRVVRDLERVATTFYADWEKVSAYLQENSHVQAKMSYRPAEAPVSNVDLQRNFLWAWLNVNTRCIYHRLKKTQSDPDNMTLCPILDFANHTTQSTPLSTPKNVTNVAPGKKGTEDLTFLSPGDNWALPGQELFLKYGSHSNCTLFVEYGFLTRATERELLEGTAQADVDVGQAIEWLIEGKGNLGLWMKDWLEAEGYWGNWSIHTSPAPAHPSYRLITTLRLYHVLSELGADSDLPENSDEVLDEWRKATLGEREIISEQNEALWKATLLSICNAIIREAEAGVVQVKRRASECTVDWGKWMYENIEMLWKEELHTAKAVVRCIEEDVQF